MTLLEVCDRVNATLVIKRLNMREGANVKYTVNMQGAIYYGEESIERGFVGVFPKKPLVINEDVNIAIQELCDRISNTTIKCGHSTLDVGKVEKGNFCIMGVW